MRRLLIANRGEIACRIIRSARALGLETVAVYSEADAGALHVQMADMAVEIGPPQAAQSYLDAGRILAAAAQSGADAVHPGYGFLSENAGFAEAVQAGGLIWVGPAPETIRQMGDKQTARETAARAGVPVLPGSPRLVPEDGADIAAAARSVGLPLLVKAAAGGGGIGMRRADRAEDVPKIVAAAQGAARQVFGCGDVYLERLVARARHVEVQVFGLGGGRAVHLFERDCSLQRRYQKVIEEAPAPALPEETRAALCAAACALCRETGYEGAGTVEFVLDAETGAFYFLEMNTRIQVEHPVSEMVTGADLVAMQLDQARGRAPTLPETPAPQGHAIECRLYAERPARMFLPSPGTLARFDLPAPAPDLRVETGLRAGDAVTPYYDPMIAKIVAHGPDRAAAIARARAALEATAIEGIATNRDFLLNCLAHPDFAAGHVSTGFIEANLEGLIGAPAHVPTAP